MAKGKLERVNSLSGQGILNVDDMTFEIDDMVFDLKDLFEPFNGEFVTLSCKIKEDGLSEVEGDNS